MTLDAQSQKRAIAYSFLAHAHNSGNFSDGPLDVFTPIVKHALSELYPEGTVMGANVAELASAIEERFGLEFPYPIIGLIMSKIAKMVNAESGVEDIILYDDGAFIINKFCFESYKESIQKSKMEVASVVNLFKKFCSIYDITGTASETDLLLFIEQNKVDISYYLSHNINESDKQSILAAQFVDYFKQAPTIYDTLRNLYLGSLLTSYLSYQPTEVKFDVELVLDTNFIVSLLDLNTIESTKTCNTLISMCKKLGYKFTVLKDTVEEFQALLNYKAQSLGGAIIARTINKEDIYNACDRRKLTKTDLERIADNIEETLLNEFGFYIIPHTEKWRKPAKFSREYEILKKIRSSEKAALHDATAILYIQEKRENKKIKRFEDIRCWFVNNAISHNGELDANVESFLGDTSAQPEIIKADDLLNIIWLTSPTLGWDKEVIDLGLASMVSYTINSSLPKARIIKELDENIQKYSASNNITDKDVLRLATRIAHRQIEDVQSLNDIARRDEVEFAKRVKEESDKQKEIDSENAQKLQSLMDSFKGLIETLKQNKENQEEKYKVQLNELNEKEVNLQLKEVDITNREKTLHDKKNALVAKNIEQEQQLRQLWTKENTKRRNSREEYISSIINKEKLKAKRWFIISLILLVIFIAGLCCTIFLIPSDYQLPNTWSVKIVSIIASSLLSFIVTIWTIFIARHYYNWYKNPSFEKNKRDLIFIPEDYQEISFEDFISSVKAL